MYSADCVVTYTNKPFAKGFPTKLFVLLNLANAILQSSLPLTLRTSSSLEQLKSSPQKRSSASSSPNKPTPPPPPPSSSPPPLSSSASPGLQAGRSQSSKPCKYGLRQNRRRPSTREVSCWLQEVCFPHQFFPSEITNCTLCMLRCCRIQTIQWR